MISFWILKTWSSIQKRAHRLSSSEEKFTSVLSKKGKRMPKQDLSRAISMDQIVWANTIDKLSNKIQQSNKSKIHLTFLWKRENKPALRRESKKFKQMMPPIKVKWTL